ncbi:MAG: ATP-dependent DNA helicase RecG [Patescibacteria group bacterium]
MYSFSSPLSRVKGIGEQTARQLDQVGITTVKELLLSVPLRYEDRSHFTTIAAAPENELITFRAKVLTVNASYRGRRSITTARVSDESGTIQLMWFQSSFVKNNLRIGSEYLFSGKINERGIIVHPVFEPVRSKSLHTNRLVPLYTSTLTLKQGTLRRILMHILDNLGQEDDPLVQKNPEILPLSSALKELHFPSDLEAVIAGRERLALEELLGLLRHSDSIKKAWKRDHAASPITQSKPQIPTSIPFTLTKAQQRSIKEICDDLNDATPMNRILIGDVGSGKTVVAGAAALQVLAAGFHTCLVAPTQMLAEQHAKTMQLLFSETAIEVLTSRQKKPLKLTQPTLIIGTHAVINQLEQIQPRLVIYDEQHRFGVSHRSKIQKLKQHPHTLTMTATPIPRTLLLTIFSHLQVSVLDELPKDRLPTKTWLLNETKREGMYNWVAEQIAAAGSGNFLTLMVCPFIDPSESDALVNVKASTQLEAQIQERFAKTAKIELLHGRLPAREKDRVITKLFDKKIDILVTTPIVEVGIDLPQASAIVIESAERYGLASLHQLRGRVGRAGQQGYCALLTSDGKTSSGRLKQFAKIHDGQTLAELDLKHRGAGDLFGTAQHGFDDLQFASWTNIELIKQAQELYKQLPADWQPFFEPRITDSQVAAN